ncbi:Glyoxalase ElbB [invertebrate metagenome]|uniref:Glyoxalase ElbB n=1 Tax=invertebrate metagenome TaxID=1711999 RepID=A0A2H9T9U2_9ZZZZ
MSLKKIAVVLSGCGVLDGTEIHESVLTMLYLDQSNIDYQCFAPDCTQSEVINHLNNQLTDESRNVLVESARIARGNVKPITELNINEFDGVICPGGFGAAKNLTNFSEVGDQFAIRSDVYDALKAFVDNNKPVGLLCIAPVMSGRLFPGSVKCTVGTDQEMMSVIRETGASPVPCPVHDIVVDDVHKLVTTPAYMLAGRISEAADGIRKLVDKVLEFA